MMVMSRGSYLEITISPACEKFGLTLEPWTWHDLITYPTIV
jgi:hypothetical protein